MIKALLISVSILCLCEPAKADMVCQKVPGQLGYENCQIGKVSNSECPTMSDTASLELRIEHIASGYLAKLTITSREDCIKIKDISVNRGNCKMGMPHPWPNKTFKFGDWGYILASCDPIEAAVSTDRGVFVYEFSGR